MFFNNCENDTLQNIKFSNKKVTTFQTRLLKLTPSGVFVFIEKICFKNRFYKKLNS